MKITFKEEGTTMVSEVFGWSIEQYDKLCRKITMALAEPMLDDEDKRSTTKILADWLETDAERQGFKFETAEDYLILGYAFHGSVSAAKHMAEHHNPKDDDDDLPEGAVPVGAIGIPKETKKAAMEILKKKIAEAVHEIKEKTGKEPDVRGMDSDGFEIIDDEPKKDPKKKLPN